jgi:hypothetical protein
MPNQSSVRVTGAATANRLDDHDRMIPIRSAAVSDRARVASP